MFQPSPPCSAAPWHFSKTSWLFSSCPSPSICSSVKARQFFLKWRKNDWMISQQSSQKMVGMHLPLGSHSKNPTKFQGFCQGFSSHLNVMSAWFVQRPLPSSPVYLFTESRRPNGVCPHAGPAPQVVLISKKTQTYFDESSLWFSCISDILLHNNLHLLVEMFI